MSARKAVRLFCDHDTPWLCRRTITILVPANTAGSGLHIARERAARLGWTSYEEDGVDYCPDHG